MTWEWIDDLSDMVDNMASDEFIDNHYSGAAVVRAFNDLHRSFVSKNKAIAEIIGGFAVSNFELHESLVAQSNAFDTQRRSLVAKFIEENEELVSDIDRLNKLFNQLAALYSELLRFEKFVIRAQQDPEFREEVGDFSIDTESGWSWYIWLIIIGVGGYFGYKYMKKHGYIEKLQDMFKKE